MATITGMVAVDADLQRQGRTYTPGDDVTGRVGLWVQTGESTYTDGSTALPNGSAIVDAARDAEYAFGMGTRVVKVTFTDPDDVVADQSSALLYVWQVFRDRGYSTAASPTPNATAYIYVSAVHVVAELAQNGEEI